MNNQIVDNSEGIKIKQTIPQLLPNQQEEVKDQNNEELPAKDQTEDNKIEMNQRPLTPIQNINPLNNDLHNVIPNIKPSTSPDLNQMQNFQDDTNEKAQSTLPESLLKGASVEEMKSQIMKNLGKNLNSRKSQKSNSNSEKQSANDVRNDFLIYLAKVYDKNTSKEGVLGCHRIIQRNVDNPQILRIVLAALCDRSIQAAQQQQGSFNGSMFHVQMFGYLAQCFKDELKDPLDKPPSLVKTISRIQETIYTFFKEGNKLVWRGCGLSLGEILDNCFPDRSISLSTNIGGTSIDTVSNLFIDPLIKFLQQGTNKASQQGACYCLKHLIEHFIDKGYQDMIDQASPSIILTVSKYQIDNSDLIQGVIKIINHMNVKVVSNYVPNLIGLSLRILGQPKQNNAIKKSACDLLTALAVYLKPIADLIVPQYQKDVLAGLDLLNSEKLNLIIEARNQAQKAWAELEKAFQEMEPHQKLDISGMLGKAFQNQLTTLKQGQQQNIVNPGSKLSVMRDVQKQNKELKERQTSADSSRKIDFTDANLSQKLLAQDFLKKGRGQGGGNSSSPQITKEKAIYEDLNKIQELNQQKRQQSPLKQEIASNKNLRQNFLSAMNVQEPLMQLHNLNSANKSQIKLQNTNAVTKQEQQSPNKTISQANNVPPYVNTQIISPNKISNEFQKRIQVKGENNIDRIYHPPQYPAQQQNTQKISQPQLQQRFQNQALQNNNQQQYQLPNVKSYEPEQFKGIGQDNNQQLQYHNLEDNQQFKQYHDQQYNQQYDQQHRQQNRQQYNQLQNQETNALLSNQKISNSNINQHQSPEVQYVDEIKLFNDQNQNILLQTHQMEQQNSNNNPKQLLLSNQIIDTQPQQINQNQNNPKQYQVYDNQIIPKNITSPYQEKTNEHQVPNMRDQYNQQLQIQNEQQNIQPNQIDIIEEQYCKGDQEQNQQEQTIDPNPFYQMSPGTKQGFLEGQRKILQEKAKNMVTQNPFLSKYQAQIDNQNNYQNQPNELQQKNNYNQEDYDENNYNQEESGNKQIQPHSYYEVEKDNHTYSNEPLQHFKQQNTTNSPQLQDEQSIQSSLGIQRNQFSNSKINAQYSPIRQLNSSHNYQQRGSHQQVLIQESDNLQRKNPNDPEFGIDDISEQFHSQRHHPQADQQLLQIHEQLVKTYGNTQQDDYNIDRSDLEESIQPTEELNDRLTSPDQFSAQIITNKREQEMRKSKIKAPQTETQNRDLNVHQRNVNVDLNIKQQLAPSGQIYRDNQYSQVQRNQLSQAVPQQNQFGNNQNQKINNVSNKNQLPQMNQNANKSTEQLRNQQNLLPQIKQDQGFNQIQNISQQTQNRAPNQGQKNLRMLDQIPNRLYQQEKAVIQNSQNLNQIQANQNMKPNNQQQQQHYSDQSSNVKTYPQVQLSPKQNMDNQNSYQNQQPSTTSAAQQQQQIAKMISQQILLMQKQMEKGFTVMHDKIKTIEGRVDNAAGQLEIYDKSRGDDLRQNRQKEQVNQQMFRAFQESINSQQIQLRDHISKTDQLSSNINGGASIPGGQYPDGAQRENRWKTNGNEGQGQYPLTSQQTGMEPGQQTGVQNQQAYANLQQQKRNRSPNKQSKITNTWIKAMDLVKKRSYEEAYKLLLKEGDDMYLLRLVAQTGPVIKFLDDQTSITVINRINKIVRSGAFEQMEIEWLEDANRRGLFSTLSKHEQNEYLDTLFQFSRSKLNPKISEKAASVYSQIKITNQNDAQNKAGRGQGVHEYNVGPNIYSQHF